MAGRVVMAHGDPHTLIYPRSAIKPFQAHAAARLARQRPTSDGLAIMSASHTGSRRQQAAVLRVLDRAGLTPMALRCPRALPSDPAVLRERPDPTRVAHNCSGKHAGFLVATIGAGADPAGYLRTDAAVQQAVRSTLAATCAAEPAGPGVDGCGAPAWRLPLAAVAHGFAMLAAPDGELTIVAAAMRAHPDLVGGDGVIDTELMRADHRVIAKRGAEATLGVAIRAADGPLGLAIKISDGGARALGPVAVGVLTRLGMRGPAKLGRPVVTGGDEPHGVVEVVDELGAALDRLG